MDPSAALMPALAALVGGVFAALVWRAFSQRRRAYELLWALGLSAYALASAVDAFVALRGWALALYVGYLAFASGNVGLLGAGTLLLLRSRRVRYAGEAFAVLAALGMLVVIVGASLARIDADLLASQGPAAGLAPLARDAPGSAARLAFILESALGGLALIGGALWSAWRFKRPGVLLIGVGALLVATGGTVEGLVSRYATHSNDAALAARLATQLLGILVMFAGYLQGRDVGAARGQKDEWQRAEA